MSSCRLGVVSDHAVQRKEGTGFVICAHMERGSTNQKTIKSCTCSLQEWNKMHRYIGLYANENGAR